jgi:hypothetical protein
MRLGIGRSFSESSTMVGSRLAWWLAGMCWEKRSFRAALVDFAQFHTALLGEAQRSLGRIAFGVEGGLQWRAVDVDAAVRLLGGQLAISTARRRGAAYTCLPA